MDALDERWYKIGDDIGSEKYTDYILHEWNSRNKLVREKDLFKNIRSAIRLKADANDYLIRLSGYSQLYAALLNPNDEFWKDSPKPKEVKDNLEFLKLFNIKQPRSLLFISYIKQREHFPKILNWIRIFSLRYNVICSEHSGKQGIAIQ